MITSPAPVVPPPAPPGISRSDRPLRACLAFNVVGAGLPGLALLVDPALAPEMAGASAAPEVARLVGAVWTAIGVVSVASLRRPREARGLLAVQVVYKATYVAAVGIPAIVAGSASATTVGLTVGFAAIAAGWTAALIATRRVR